MSDPDVQASIPMSGDWMDKKSRRAFPAETVYTLVPAPFSLPQMVQHPVPFRAQVYRGHFERGGALIAEGVQAQIRRVVYFEKFDPGAPRAAAVSYLLFGDETEQFAAHLISVAPDFDQITQLEAPELGRVIAGAVLVGSLPDTRGPLDGSAPELKFVLPSGSNGAPAKVREVLYLEFDDLAR